jgi:predicted glycosyltransferase
MRLLIYSQDSMGLGHLRRTHNIAQGILALEPDSSILILADSPVTPFFPPLRGVDYLKLPTIVKVDSTSWRTSTLSLNIEDMVNLRAEVILRTFCAFKPDAVLVDHMPVGALGELKPLLDSTTRDAGQTMFFLGLRDILGTPEVIRQVWTETESYEYLLRYNSVLVYGCREIYDAESAYNLGPYSQKVIYCNYVTPRGQVEQPDLSLDEPFVLVMGGGGADAFALAKAFLDALPIVLQKVRLQALILTGPNMPYTDRETLIAEASPYPFVQIQSSAEDAIELLKNASAVVTMAGYNSLCETLMYRKKALVIPRGGPSAEQRIRSELFSKLHLVSTLDPDGLTAEITGQELVQLLVEDGVPDLVNIPPLDGAQKAAALLVSRARTVGQNVVA